MIEWDEFKVCIPKADPSDKFEHERRRKVIERELRTRFDNQMIDVE